MIKQAFKKGEEELRFGFPCMVGGASWYVFLAFKQRKTFIHSYDTTTFCSSRNRIHSCNVLGNIYNESTLIKIRRRRTMNTK